MNSKRSALMVAVVMGLMSLSLQGCVGAAIGPALGAVGKVALGAGKLALNVAPPILQTVAGSLQDPKAAAAVNMAGGITQGVGGALAGRPKLINQPFVAGNAQQGGGATTLNQ